MGAIGSDNPEAMAAVFDEHGDDIAGVLSEPVQGAGGGWPAPPGYLDGLRRLCDAHDAYLIFDEVITGDEIDQILDAMAESLGWVGRPGLPPQFCPPLAGEGASAVLSPARGGRGPTFLSPARGGRGPCIVRGFARTHAG